MASAHRDHPDMDAKSGQPKDGSSRQQVEKAHGRYSASDAKEGRKGRLPSSHAPGEQPKRSADKE
jgi:hypothetical protein